MIKNILFDLGGVLIRLTMEECLKRFKEIGVHDAHQLLNPYRQEGIFFKLENGDLSAYEFTEVLRKRYNSSITYNDIEYCLLGFVENVQAYKFDFIDEHLTADYNLYLLSNNNPFVYNWCNSDNFLPNKRKIESYFKRTYCSYRIGLCKPDKEIYEITIEDSGLIPQETLFIDDSPKNIEVGKDFGFETLNTSNGEDWRESLLDTLNKLK